jgi:hypothetical protein
MNVPFEILQACVSRGFPLAWIFAAVHRKSIRLKADPFALCEEINHHPMQIAFPKGRGWLSKQKVV